MLAQERRAGGRVDKLDKLDKLFLACVVPDRHIILAYCLLAREGASGA